MPVRSVLVVDDSPLVRQAVSALFTHEGDFDVCGEAENGREAIEKAQLLRPNLIVTDLSMPVMNGLEETRVLKKLMPAVPVIIFTARGARPHTRAAMLDNGGWKAKNLVVSSRTRSLDELSSCCCRFLNPLQRELLT